MPFVLLLCIFSSLHIVIHIAFCCISLPAKYFQSILLQLPFGEVYCAAYFVFTCRSCINLLPYIPGIYVQFFLAVLKALSVYLQPIYSFVLD